MIETPFTIHIKFGKYEIELTGSRIEVMQTLDNLPNIVEKINKAFNSIQVIKGFHQELMETERDSFPTISAQAGMSCPEAIIAILSTEWGRRKPRRLREITEAMKVNALHFPIGTVKGRLTDLTKKGVIRRIRGEKGYNYVVSN